MAGSDILKEAMNQALDTTNPLVEFSVIQDPKEVKLNNAPKPKVWNASALGWSQLPTRSDFLKALELVHREKCRGAKCT